MATLEELKKQLYKKGESFEKRTHSPDISRFDFKKKEFEYSKEGRATTKIDLKKFMSSKIFSLIAGIIVVLVVFVFFSNTFNFQNVDLKIEGIKDVKSGESIVFKVIAKNLNKKDIEEVSLIFNIPEFFRERIKIGTLKSGDTKELEFETVIFGGRGKTFEARALFEYRPKESSSFFVEEELFTFAIAQSPVTISFLMPDEITAGDEVKLVIKYFSQSNTKLEKLFLKVDYPAIFEYKNSDKKPIEKNNIWEIGELNPGEEGSIQISGVLKDALSGVSSFAALIGTRSGEKFLSLDETVGSLVLRLPYLGVDILPKGEKETLVASIGEEIPILIGWKNNLPEILEDASLEIVFFGDAVDLNSVRVRDGFFNSKDKKIIWNSSSFEDFSNISPGSSGFLGFSIKIKKDISLLNVGKNPVIGFKASFKPGKLVPGFEESNIFGEDEIEIPISSAIQFSQKGLYFDSSLVNTGPLPPKVGKETTYTIMWSLANPLNDIKNLVVKTILPPYVSFKENFVPSAANIVFDKNTGVLEWGVGTLEAGVGFTTPALSLSFQVGVTPSITHIDSSPQIISQTEVFGFDSFTEKNLTALQSEITTELRDDTQLDFLQKKVVK